MNDIVKKVCVNFKSDYTMTFACTIEHNLDCVDGLLEKITAAIADSIEKERS